MAINDLGPVETNAHLLRFDSVHGRFPAEVTTTDSTIDVGRGPIDVTAIRNPAELPWDGVDVVLECTGIFTDRDKAAVHLENGAYRVLVSAPSKGADNTIVYGVNHDTLTSDQIIVSNASCTTNCLSPVAKALNDAIGIKRGFMTTIHSYTGDQPTLDTMHKDLYRARAAAMSTGDMGFTQTKKYDVEVWSPGQQRLLEVSSCSNFEAFQARRMQLRYRNGEKETEMVHTLNGSGLALPRVLSDIVETYQTENGRVRVPDI